jgi:hypothetical protein
MTDTTPAPVENLDPNPTIAPSFEQLVTPEQIKAVSDKVDEVTENPEAIALEATAASKLPQKARAVIYEVGQWAGAAAAVGSTLVAFLDGKPALYVGAIAGLLLAVSNNIAKAHIGKA